MDEIRGGTARTRTSRIGDVSTPARWARYWAKAVVLVSVVLVLLVLVLLLCILGGSEALQLCEDAVQSGKGAACHGEDDPRGGRGF